MKRVAADLTGRSFGDWLVLARAVDSARRMWLCRCACGTERLVASNNLTAGRSSSCVQCGAKRRVNRGAPVAGERFGRLSVTADLGMRAGLHRVAVRCDCGADREVCWSNLYSGGTKSCGCFALEMAGANLRTHGMSDTPEYHTWNSMLQRCHNENDSAYDNYGGRGIQVCPEWRESFETFFAYVGERPGPKHTLDRFPDQNGNYEPGNVRWATKKEQAQNTRRNVWLEHDGKRLVASDWARELGISRQAIERRLAAGWTVERVCTKGAAAHARKLRGFAPGTVMIRALGEAHSLAEWARITGIRPQTIGARLRRGIAADVALTSPLRTGRTRKAAA